MLFEHFYIFLFEGFILGQWRYFPSGSAGRGWRSAGDTVSTIISKSHPPPNPRFFMFPDGKDICIIEF